MANYPHLILNQYQKVGQKPTHAATPKNQSVENAGVAFVKGANESNEFFEKIESNIIIMTNMFGRTGQRSNNLRDELIWG